jgi:nicotinamidase-related amidase
MQTRSHGLRFGPLGENCVHICVDMQRLFFEERGWQMTWMRRVLPNVRRIASAYPDRTFFTRFIPAVHPGDGIGSWRRYYRRWAGMTLKNIGEEMAHLLPELEALSRPRLSSIRKSIPPSTDYS